MKEMKENIISFLHSFVYAAKGVERCLSQRNMRFHICAAGAVTALAVMCGFSAAEYALLFIVISAVMSAEVFNTAVENAVDLFSKERSELAAAAKDCAAGAVLITAVGAAAAGIFMFFVSGRIYAACLCFIRHPVLIAAAAGYVVFSVWFVFLFKINKKI